MGKRPKGDLELFKFIGQQIKKARVGDNIGHTIMTQTTLANAIGVTFQQVQKYEKGANGICALKLKKLADFFKVGCDVLVDPNMITSHRGFTGNMDWIVGNNQNPKILVGSLKEIKDELVKDGINPEETILPTLRNAAKKEMN